MGAFKKLDIESQESGVRGSTQLELPLPEVSTDLWTKERIQNLLETSDQAVIRALQQIYARQTESEKALKTTKVQNSVGFSGIDAAVLSSFCEFYKRTGFLTTAQMKVARNKVKKYWKQLLQIVESKGKPVTYKRTA